MYDTEFEEDMSDIEEYSGRRSEESVSPRTLNALSFGWPWSELGLIG